MKCVPKADLYTYSSAQGPKNASYIRWPSRSDFWANIDSTSNLLFLRDGALSSTDRRKTLILALVCVCETRFFVSHNHLKIQDEF